MPGVPEIQAGGALAAAVRPDVANEIKLITLENKIMFEHSVPPDTLNMRHRCQDSRAAVGSRRAESMADSVARARGHSQRWNGTDARGVSQRACPNSSLLQEE
jgi:hypothetical protein